MSNTSKMRETPKSFYYYLHIGNMCNTRGNDLENSKNVKDWTIRSQGPKFAMREYG